MNAVFGVRMHRAWSATIVILIGALCLGAWVLLWDPSASSAAPGVTAGDISAAAAKLETLHQRAVARTQAQEDDDNSNNPNSHHPTFNHAVTPELAAMLATQLAHSRGDAAAKHSYIELVTRGNRAAYAVRIGAHTLYVDADTGAASD